MLTSRPQVCVLAQKGQVQDTPPRPPHLLQATGLACTTSEASTSFGSGTVAMPVTFGSVGDIIVVCVLVKDCVDALNETRGSAAECQAVIQELCILEKASLEVGILSKTHATTPEPQNVFANLTTTIEQCRTSLASFKSRIEPYNRDLADVSSAENASRAFAGPARKLLWQVRMKDDISRFRAKIVAHSISIGQLLAAATMSVSLLGLSPLISHAPGTR